MNSLFTIHPYKENGVWVFDDEATGLVREPFVAGMPEIFAAMGVMENSFSAVFSDTEFPGAKWKLCQIRHYGVQGKLVPTYGGTFYLLDGTDLVGWLCPALFKYFPKAPESIYIQIL